MNLPGKKRCYASEPPGNQSAGINRNHGGRDHDELEWKQVVSRWVLHPIESDQQCVPETHAEHDAGAKLGCMTGGTKCSSETSDR